MTAAAWAAPFLILAGACACAWWVLAGHQQPGCLRRTLAVRTARILIAAAIAVLAVRAVSIAVVRARWAWRCRGKPVPGDGEDLTREEIQVLGNLAAGRDVRSRT